MERIISSSSWFWSQKIVETFLTGIPYFSHGSIPITTNGYVINKRRSVTMNYNELPEVHSRANISDPHLPSFLSHPLSPLSLSHRSTKGRRTNNPTNLPHPCKDMSLNICMYLSVTTCNYPDFWWMHSSVPSLGIPDCYYLIFMGNFLFPSDPLIHSINTHEYTLGWHEIQLNSIWNRN